MSRRLNIPTQKKPLVKKRLGSLLVSEQPLALQIEKIIAEGLKLHQSGNLLEAKKFYEKVLNVQPQNFTGLQLMGLLFAQLNENNKSLEYLNSAIKINPKFVPCYVNRGITLQALKKYAEAISSYDQAISIEPSCIEAYSNKGIALHTLKKYDEALFCYDKAIELKKDFADAYSNRGNTLQELKKFKEALACYDKAIELKQDYADAYLNRGNALKELKLFDEAISSYRKGIYFQPNYSEIHYSLGNIFQELKQYDAALACYDKVISIKSNYEDAHLNKGAVLHKLKRYDEALNSYDKVILIKPDYVKGYTNRGALLKDLKQFTEAIASYKKSISIDPNYTKAYFNLGVLFIELGKLDDAIKCFDQIIKINPKDAQAYYDLGTVVYEQSKYREAMQYYRQAITLNPSHEVARSNILFTQAYTGISDPREYFSDAKKMDLVSLTEEEHLAARNKVFNREPLLRRRLKIGYVSGDYYHHAASYFLEELFKQHDKSKIEIYAYSTNEYEDTITTRIKSLVDHWSPIFDILDDEVLNLIESHSLDILIDLSGHTANNRLNFFARRAAPIQAHYLGYFASTGLTQMDYWIGDEILLPQQSASYFSEKLYRLPRVWVSYKGDLEAPTSKWVPDKNNKIWLGSFNDLGKITPSTIEIWAKILHSIPKAHLLLKTKKLSNATNCQAIIESMELHGIAHDRIELQDGTVTPNWETHMKYYDRLDIALDPIGGASGGTTTCDALWMGVPVITKAQKDGFAGSRMSASMLSAAGHSEWIANSEAEYVDKVIELAENVEYRKSIRFTQRNRMAQSSLCDSKGLAKSLEDAYESMFNKWYEKNNSDNQNNREISTV